MRVRQSLLALLIPAVLATVTIAAEPAEKLPGYVDFSALRIARTLTPTAELALDGALLKATAAQDTGLSAKRTRWMSKLESMRITTYSLKGCPHDDYGDRIDTLLADMRAAGWRVLMGARNPGNRAYICALQSGERTVGLVDIAYNQGISLSWINLVGEIDQEIMELLDGGGSGSAFDTMGTRRR